MLPYEEHLRAGGAEFKVPETPVATKPRGIRGRKPLSRGKKPGPKPKEKKVASPGDLSPPVHEEVNTFECLKVFETFL